MGADTTLAQKLLYIYNDCKEDFLRVDADVIPNKRCTKENIKPRTWWTQYTCFDWFKQDISNGGIQFIKKQALPALRENIPNHMGAERPETEMSRIKEFNNPRRFVTSSQVFGLHNYKNDIERVRETKERRNQLELYDFELAERLSAL